VSGPGRVGRSTLGACPSPKLSPAGKWLICLL